MPLPTLKDIAATTGLHPMTVSRALRDVGRMKPATRQRVQEAALKLGYRPHAAAAALRSGHTGCIALLSARGASEPPLPAAALTAVIEALASRGGFLAHAALAADANLASALPRLLGRRMAEGLLVPRSFAPPAAFDAFLRQGGLPAVWLDVPRPVNAVYADDRAAMWQVVETLAAQNRQRIVCVRRGGADAALANGYDAAMRAAGLRPEVVEIALMPTGAADAAARWRDADALIVTRYDDALIATLRCHSSRASEDLTIVAFADEAGGARNGAASVVLHPCAEIGRRAVVMLYRLIEEGLQELPSVVVPCDFSA